MKEFMKITIYEPSELFIDYVRREGEKIQKHPNDFIQTISAFNLFDSSDEPILYFKDTHEFILLEEYIYNDQEERGSLSLDNIIIFMYESIYYIQEEIENCGLDCFFDSKVLLEWEQYLKDKTNPPTSKLGKLFIEKANLGDNLFSLSFYTLWESWSNKSWTDCGYEYDAGIDYRGIVDIGSVKCIGVSNG